MWLVLLLALLACLTTTNVFAQSTCQSNCTFYASSNGTGSTCSLGSPCSVQELINNKIPPIMGTQPINVCMLAAPSRLYQGEAYMIESGRFNTVITGTAANPIRFCSADSTAPYTNVVILDGENTRQPIHFRGNTDYVIVEDLNARRSFRTVDGGKQPVVETGEGCSGDVEESCSPNGMEFRRLVLWDDNNVNSGNASTFSISYCIDCISEDIAIPHSNDRKVFQSFNGLRGRFTRIFGVWNGTSQTGVKTAYDCSYHSIDHTCENVLFFYEGSDFTTAQNFIFGGPAGRIEYSDRNDWNGINATRFGVNTNIPELAAGVDDNTWLGDSLFDIGDSIYVDTPYNLIRVHTTAGGALQNSNNSCTEATNTWFGLTVRCQNTIADCASIEGFFVRRYDGDTACTDCIPNQNTYDKLLTIGGAAPIIHATQAAQVTNRREIATIADYPPGESLYEGTLTPNMCFKRVNRVLTSDPLWPWAMTGRINEMYTYTGLTPAIDVDAHIAASYGAPPAQCVAGAPPSSIAVIDLEGDTSLSGGVILQP